MEINFGLNGVSKHGSGFPEFVKETSHIFIVMSFSSSYEILGLKFMNIIFLV